MNRISFIVLSVLLDRGATDKLKAMTAREIAEAEALEYRENTLYKKIREFVLLGYAAEGLKEGRAFSFYITEKGIRHLEKQKETK